MKSLLGYTSTPSTLLQNWKSSAVKPSIKSNQIGHQSSSRRRNVVISTSIISLSLLAEGATNNNSSVALAENWGVRSFIWEKFFEPDLSPEDSVARIRQTAEGLHALRHMLDTFAWRYIIFYIRVKQSYLSKDLNIAMSTLPKQRWKDYVDLANDLVHNMSKFDEFVRSPKVYESYLYYEKTLKSIDDIVAYLA